VQLRCARRLRGAGVGDGGERFVIDFDALVACASVSAITATTGSPPWRTVARASAKRGGSTIAEPSRERTAHSGRIGAMPSVAMSAPVNTPTTPGMALAAAVSIPRTRAWAWGERTSTQASAPESSMSATKRPRPSRKRRSSTRRNGAPMPW
jgi:hypothetical protein